MGDDTVDLDDAMSDVSEDPIQVARIVRWLIDDDGYLAYEVITRDSTCESIDRSDLMDSGRHQRMVLDFEKRFPPPWDESCPLDSDGEECDDSVCDECERRNRFLNGVNYGCSKHPTL